MNEQPSKPPKTVSKKLLGVLGTVATFIVVIIAAAIGKNVGREGTKALLRGSDDAPPVCSYSAATWSTRNLGDISLDAPFSFGPGPDVTSKLPTQVRDALAYYEVLDSGESTNPRATVSRIAYKPDVQLGLDGAMNGAMNGAMRAMAAASGESNPQFSSTVTSIDGLPARRASYIGRVRGTSISSRRRFCSERAEVLAGAGRVHWRLVRFRFQAHTGLDSHQRNPMKWPNHALQRTAPAVTLAASAAAFPPAMQPARQPPQSPRLGSLAGPEPCPLRRATIGDGDRSG